MASTSEPLNLSKTIPFSLFASLLSDISKVAMKTRNSNLTGPGTSKNKDYPAIRVFSQWVAYLRATFEHKEIEDTSTAIFRLLFPDMDVNRRFDMQEARLAQHLIRILGTSTRVNATGSRLSRWSADGSSGCLGVEVREILAAAPGAINQRVGPSVLHVDRLLTQLASFSPFSHSSIQEDPNLPSSRVEMLKSLYSALSPAEASFVTQIILKDLRTVLYPSRETHYTAALKNQKSNSVIHLDVVDALKVWDPTLNALSRWRVVSSFEVALAGDHHRLVSVGIPLQIPKTIKGTGCAEALKIFSNSRLLWAETKYDGERAQIHVKVDHKKGSVELRIFSKSKRESTNDRHAVHQIILDALGLPGSVISLTARNGMSCIAGDVILEAEMVAFSNITERIDEFWRIRSLIESTAIGPRHRVRKVHEETNMISQCSLRSDASDEGTRHLALVFFDVLLLDSRPLVSLPYHERRKILESVVLPIPGLAMLAERSPIEMFKGREVANDQLKSVLAKSLADHQEGLVLKANEGAYIKSPWVKLKKDYIPGLGDCVDLVVVGACWEKDRGRELRVPPSVFTTFHLGMLTNADALRVDASTPPSFRAFFTTSYGLSRDQLEDLNFMIKSSNSMTYDEYCRKPHQLGYDMSLFVAPSLPKPSVVLLKDSLILAEVYGAGFTKAPGGKYYELRFPRMTKAYRRRERTWRECISLEEFQHIARETVGRERPDKEADDWCKGLFGKVASPGVKDPLRKRQREAVILADLERIEERHRDGGRKAQDHNSKKRKRAVDPGVHPPDDRRARRRGSTYLENTGLVVQGSPSRAALPQRHGVVSLISPVTPTRPRVSRGLAPLGSMTNVAVTDPATPPKSPLDGKGRKQFGFDQIGKGGGSKNPKARLSGSPDPFIGDKRGDRVDSILTHSFAILPPVPLPPLPTASLRRKRMDPQGDIDLRKVPDNSPEGVGINVQPAAEKTTPPVSQINPGNRSRYVTGRSLPTPVSNEPTKRVPPLVTSPTVAGADIVSVGTKRMRETEEDTDIPSKRVALGGPSPTAEKFIGSPRDLKPSETWGPDETTFMEEPRSRRETRKSKIHKGEMSVDAIKARLIKATSTLQILPSLKSDTAAQNRTAVTEPCDVKAARVEERVVRERTLLEGEPIGQKAGSSALMFGIPAPFPPGTSGPGSSLGCPNNSDKIAAYDGADKFYSSRPPSATPPQPPKIPQSTNEVRVSLTVPLLSKDMKQDDELVAQSGILVSEKKVVTGRFPSLTLEPQRLLFTDTAVGSLLSTSVVWFARDAHNPEPAYRPSSLQLVPRLNEVTQFKNLLVACGWHRKKAFSSKRGIERGVVFVDYEEQGDVQSAIKTHWVAQQCENAYRHATQYQTAEERGMRPVWIVDAKVLRWERLGLMKSRDPLGTLEDCVLWRKL